MQTLDLISNEIPDRCNTSICIPTHVQSSVLPPVWISTLLRFQLPAECVNSTGVSTSRIEDWFSLHSVDATFTPAALIYISLPPIEIVNKLNQAVDTTCLTSLQSLVPLHLPTEYEGPYHLPLWVVRYWREAHNARESRIKWMTALRWVDRYASGSEEGRSLQKEILAAITQIRWSDPMSGTITGSGGVQGLTRFLGSVPLPSESIHQLLELLRHRISLTNANISPYLITDPEFIDTLVKAQQSSATQLETGKCFKALRSFETDILSEYKSVVSGVVFVNGNHWTFFCLDVTARSLTYGDSFGAAVPLRIRDTLIWWIDRLIGLGLGAGKDTCSRNGHDWLVGRNAIVGKQAAGDS
ncbi:hypothetical protein BDY19DRAFT_998839 [Irpex rosettiformis]|uniref:Uncharacterized protein n=1 Tax=Irpex rosettiformis TaxID=378272 RepID=A0ACB8TMC7_9APHY|nr:hypothetical protein BDY19DRAFT_998839 [Irpex rosettiformis]